MMYLGTPGRMIGIKCPTAQRVTLSDHYSFNTTLGGTVKAQVGPIGRRTWDISLGQLTSPADVGALNDFATGGWGPGPFWFVPADAPVVNLLPPAAAACMPHTVKVSGGAALLGTPHLDLGDDGVAARAVWKTAAGSVAFGDPIPVIPGEPVTGSAWTVGAGRLRLVFRDATGAQVAVPDSEPSLFTSPYRIAVTTVTPSNAVTVQLTTTGPVTQVARPAITWTDQPYGWGDGQGCPKAIIHNTSRDVVKALRHPTNGQWSEVSFTVQEVG